MVVGAPTIELREPGDEVAALYVAHYSRLVSLAWLIVRSTPLAEDVVHDAFVVLQRNWGSVREPPAYLRTLVVNRCRKVSARQARERSVLPSSLPAARVEQIDEMLEFIARLPLKQRIAMVLRYYEDLPDVDIARVMGCPESTVRSHVRRGLASVREMMNDD